MDGDDNLIKNTYLNLPKPAAFLGASKIHQTLKQLGHNKPGIHKIRKWLQTQDDYSLLKHVYRHLKRAREIVSGQNEQLDIDLMDMQSLQKKNNNVKYLLVAVDVFFSICLSESIERENWKVSRKSIIRNYQES